MKVNTKEIEEEFQRIAEDLINQGNLNELLDCVPILTKKEFIESYKEESE